MLAFPATVAAYVVLFVLVVAVAERVRAPGALPFALAVHGIVPRHAVRPVAGAVTAAEVAVAAALLVGLVRASGSLTATALAVAAALFAGYGGYSRHVARSGRGGPCGCGGAEVPMGRWVMVRAVTLAALAAFAATAAAVVRPLTRVDPPLVVALLAALTIGTLLWHLPAAMHDPAPDRHHEVVP
ncbi:MauE/DoxX family redox-associated membrane protein [Actinophytocola xanthii]|uniref:Methylamine utilisation protein MauE domain-containing protein n=1 Tax=Actinophytocola xanthii TaxID=1912961 RepID=A0A1Q8CXP1_9PSEU|nr:MauE/DoxX family redox-associated membrane protein [Actinophytocola xanthii]OLF19124.1 hypothetical protein BU204_01765 [Actinophytocola xanthii]